MSCATRTSKKKPNYDGVWNLKCNGQLLCAPINGYQLYAEAQEQMSLKYLKIQIKKIS